MDEDTPAARQERNTAVLHKTKDPEAYEAACRETLNANPDDPGALVQLADALSHQRRFDEKLEILKDVLNSVPHHVQANVSLALDLMARGQFREAWPHYAYRFRISNVAIPDPGLPADRRWTGDGLTGRRICLVREQGLGDTLQFLRYGLRLREEGAIPYLNVQPSLRALLAGSPASGRVLMPGVTVDLDRWIHLVDLTPVFTETALDITWPGAYVSPLASDTPVALPSTSRGQLRVGLAWSGNPKYPSDPLRSMELRELRNLRQVPNCQFYSLMPTPADQWGYGTDRSWVVDLSSLSSPFEELARVIDRMDVVVTVCTSIAHLAGAMGKPVFILLAAHPDWRWGRDGSTSPWYPSARLFRQIRYGDWSHPVDGAAEALAALT